MKLTRSMAEVLLRVEPDMSTGDSVELEYTLTGPWKFTLTREEDKYLPSKYILMGDGGKYGTWVRRYKTMEQALLHIVNRLNENRDIPNRYATLAEWIREGD